MIQWWFLVAAVLVGHFGLHLAFYNRINAFGFPRKIIKRIVRVMALVALLIPIYVIYHYHEVLGDLLQGSPQGMSLPTPLLLYSIACLASFVVFGIPWLLWRPIFGVEWVHAPRNIEVVDVTEQVTNQLALSRRCRWEAMLPMNQIFELSIDQIELPVAGLPEALDGYRIAQLSDIHLTGHVHPDYSRYAVERATQWNPDLMALTGDIIDKQPCIDWLGEIFAPARASDGCYFVLGNHDTRIVDSWQTREAMDRAGWTDLGSRGLNIDLRGVRSLLVGNEHPWFERPVIEPVPGDTFGLLLSHSPDQFAWARRHNVTLMLAGHTHGGQGRLPLIGPLLSPSFHGSRYASGDFHRSPTTLHVTRGLSGTHLVRILCRPQVSLLTLRSVPLRAVSRRA